MGQGQSFSTSCATSKAAQCPCMCRRLLGCPPASLMASSPSGQVSPRFLPLMLGWFHQCTTTSEAVTEKLCRRRLHHLLGAMVESADQREEAFEIRNGRCKPEMWLFVSWVSVWRESAARRAMESQGGSFSERRVIYCSWPWLLFKCLPAAGKNSVFHCPVMWLRKNC